MRPSSFRPFDASDEPGPLIQQLGCILSPDRYYAVVRPEGAEPSDGEARRVLAALNAVKTGSQMINGAVVP